MALYVRNVDMAESVKNAGKSSQKKNTGPKINYSSLTSRVSLACWKLILLSFSDKNLISNLIGWIVSERGLPSALFKAK